MIVSPHRIPKILASVTDPSTSFLSYPSLLYVKASNWFGDKNPPAPTRSATGEHQSDLSCAHVVTGAGFNSKTLFL